MISVSQTYEDIMDVGGHYEWQIINDTKTINGDLKEGKLSLTLFQQASIGNVMAAQLDFEYFDDGVALDPSEPLVLQFRAVSGSSVSEWITRSTLYIDTIEQSPYSTVVKVRAFDSLLKANVPWMKEGTFTATTDLEIVQGIASDIGVSIDLDTQAMFATPIDITEAPSIGPNGTTSIEMLSYIAVMHGGNWTISPANELKLIPLFSETEIADVGDDVSDFDASPEELITGVCIWSGENNYYRVPDLPDDQWKLLGGRIIDAKCYIGGSLELAQDLYDAFEGLAYYPYTTNKAWVDLKYELGDGITIKDVTSVICDQTINLAALGSSSLSAKGNDIVSSSYPVPSPVERQVARNEAKTQASITVLGDRIESTVELIDGVQTQVTQNAEGIEAVTETLDGQSAYIRWNGATATLSIGESNAPTEAQIKPDGFSVTQDGEAIFEVKGRKATARHFEAEETVTVGRYQWVDEDSDGFSLMYIGD